MDVCEGYARHIVLDVTAVASADESGKYPLVYSEGAWSGDRKSQAGCVAGFADDVAKAAGDSIDSYCNCRGDLAIDE